MRRAPKFNRSVTIVGAVLVLGASVGLQAQDINSSPPEVSGSSQAAASFSGNFWQRLSEAYLQDWKGNAESGPTPARRIPPAPLDATPFPSADWNHGGSPVIGAPDGNTYPLMEAIDGAQGRTKIYGWVNNGFDVSTSNKTKFANAPAAYYVTPNTIIPDQQVLFIERLPDTVQTSHFDWGFRIAQLYGQDYRYTTGKGYLSQQLLQNNGASSTGRSNTI